MNKHFILTACVLFLLQGCILHFVQGDSTRIQILNKGTATLCGYALRDGVDGSWSHKDFGVLQPQQRSAPAQWALLGDFPLKYWTCAGDTLDGGVKSLRGNAQLWELAAP